MEEKHKTLIAKVLSENASLEEEKEFQNWMNSNPENKIIFKEAKKTWALTIKRDNNYTPDTKQKWVALKQQILTESKNSKSYSILSETKFKWHKLAAVFIVLIGLGYILTTNFNNQITRQTTSNLDAFYLPDSSIVYLNKNSKLSYSKRFDGKERFVELEGEAFFQVRKDPLKPFIISAENTRTEVLGTSFNLRAYHDEQDIELVVASGKVAFSNEGKKIILLKNKKGKFSKGNKELISENNNNPNFCSWKNNKVALRNSELYKLEQGKIHYLQNESRWKRNKIHQTIIEGHLYNSAIFTQYKNIQLKATYFDKEGSKIGESKFTIHKTILPGMTVRYKHPLLDWFDNTTNVTIGIEQAGEIKEDY